MYPREAKRKPLYRDLLRYLNEQSYAIPLAVPLGFAATSSTLKGYLNYHKTGLIRMLSK